MLGYPWLSPIFENKGPHNYLENHYYRDVLIGEVYYSKVATWLFN